MFEYGPEITPASDIFYIASAIYSEYCETLEMGKEKLAWLG